MWVLSQRTRPAKRPSEFPTSRYSIYVTRNWSYFYVSTSGRERLLFRGHRPTGPAFICSLRTNGFSLNRAARFLPVESRNSAPTKIIFKSRLIWRQVADFAPCVISNSQTWDMFCHLHEPPCVLVNWKNRINEKTYCLCLTSIAWSEREDLSFVALIIGQLILTGTMNWTMNADSKVCHFFFFIDQYCSLSY